ncbi:MAG: hypothetical protein HS116_02255 [Planctomycetes bacterium]|nr:hypothetical protein [Planctomycetota bacterium]
MSFARVLQAWMEREACSGKHLARRLHCRPSYVYAWLRGELPERRYWTRIEAAGIATRAQLERFEAPAAPRLKRARANPILACPHCGGLVRRRNGRPVKAEYVHG